MIEIIKKNKSKLAVLLVIILVLGAVFVLEGKDSADIPQQSIATEAPEITLEPEESAEPAVSPEPSVIPEASPSATEAPRPTAAAVAAASKQEENEQAYTLGEEKAQSTNVIKYSSQSDSNASQCTMSIYCTTLLDNMDALDRGKQGLVPSDGCILAPVKVEIEEGDNVFDILRKATKEHKIHMEFVNTPIYNSAYIEGIHNLYEFDGGELSGWMYSVNGEFPNYGCSRHEVKPGDVIVWHYTCDLGRDVAGRTISQKDE